MHGKLNIAFPVALPFYLLIFKQLFMIVCDMIVFYPLLSFLSSSEILYLSAHVLIPVFNKLIHF